jgi:transglutaminase-like putative cysteine protease
MVALCARSTERLSDIIREESGTYTPEHTLSEGRGSCRDSVLP